MREGCLKGQCYEGRAERKEKEERQKGEEKVNLSLSFGLLVHFYSLLRCYYSKGGSTFLLKPEGDLVHLLVITSSKRGLLYSCIKLHFTIIRPVILHSCLNETQVKVSLLVTILT